MKGRGLRPCGGSESRDSWRLVAWILTRVMNLCDSGKGRGDGLGAVGEVLVPGADRARMSDD
jgi:hypothetical protein